MGNNPSHLETFANTSFEILVINLDQRTDRLQYIDKLLRNAGLSYTRMPAVNGKKFSNITNICSSEGYKDLTCIGEDDRTGHLAHVGCYLSHLKCLKLASSSVFGKVLILEDDAKFITNNFKNILNKIVLENTDVDFIWLNASKDETNVVQKSMMPTWGLQGYLVNKKAAKVLYNMLIPGSPWISNMHNCLADWIMPLAVKDAGLKWKHISLISQKDFESDIRNS
jgi:GR25 family glycosyltransferase involved in LPS biosynthesis